ncbi:ABC transporter permease subunit [Actinomyces sp. ZJ308]|uniref:ABC transporter permease subunit n=1 Tax=Actinomyces sp. ZJ308 TaxID=2708342 RepID=UPI001AB03B9F|nr:ABC transporter permease subunit [Actinomyces sp. ZJ308]
MSTHTPAHAAAAPTGPASVRTAVKTAPTGPAPRPAGPRVQGRQTVLRSIRAEWIKIWTLRSTWITSFIAIALTVLFGVGVAVGYAHTAGKEAEAAHMITSGTSFGQIAVAVLGALIITGEYASGQIRSSLAATPRRGRLFAAKALVISSWAFVVGALSMLLTWTISTPFMNGHHIALNDWHYLGYFWGVGLSYAGISFIALGLGYILRSTAGTITAIMTLLYVIDIPLTVMSDRWDWAITLQGLEPTITILAIQDPFAIRQSWGYPGTVAFLEQWQALLVFSAWVLLPLTAGWILFSKRDA